MKPNLTLNLGLRWAYTSPLVEKDNRQSNFDVAIPFGGGTGVQTFAKDGSTYDRALYNPYYKGFEPRVGVAWSASDRLVFRGGYGISQYMEGTGANLRLPLNPPFFFESNVNYDATTGAGSMASGFADLVPGTTPTGNVRAYDLNLRPQFTHQWNVFAEYRLTEGDVGAGRLRRQPRRTTWWPRSKATRRCPAWAIPRPGRRRPRAGRSTARSRSSPRSRPRPRSPVASTTRSRRACASASCTASSSWPRTRSPRPTPTTAATTAAAVSSPPRAPTGPTPTTPTRSGGRRSTTCGTTSCSRAPTSCRSATAASAAPSGAAS